MSAAEELTSPTPEEIEHHHAVINASASAFERMTSRVWLVENGFLSLLPEKPYVPPEPIPQGPPRQGLRVVGAVGKKEDFTYELVFDQADEIEPTDVSWLWEGRLPNGCISIVCGDPGVGKSTIATAIAAAVSTGAEWPDRKGAENPAGRVLYFTAEESRASVIIPRLARFGADMSKVCLLRGNVRSDGLNLGFSLMRDARLLEAAVERFGDVRLIIIDPITAYLGDGDAHKDTEVRSLLQPLADLAERKGLCVLLIAHLNKGTSTNILYRLANSIAFAAVARMIWFASKHPFQRAIRSFTFVKGNYCDNGRPKGLPYRMEKRRLVWGTEAIDYDAEEIAILLADAAEKNLARGRPSTPLELAKCFLRELMLDPGSCLQSLAWSGAKNQGINESTFRKAVTQLIEAGEMVRRMVPGERSPMLEPAPQKQGTLPLEPAEAPPVPA